MLFLKRCCHSSVLITKNPLVQIYYVSLKALTEETNAHSRNKLGLRCDKIASATWLKQFDFTVKGCAESGWNRTGVEVKATS